MSNPSLIPPLATPTPPALVVTSFSIDQANLDWLDEIAERTNRSRSEVAREILRAVREQEAARASA